MLRPEETLIIEGDEAQTVYNVISGTMRLTRMSSDGRRQILTFLFTGNFVGLTPDASYHFNAEAVSEVELCAFDRKRLETLFRLHPEMQKNFHHMTAKMIDAAHDLVFTLGRKTAIERLATFLLFLRDAENVRGDSASPLSVPMTRLDIADFLGLTIETVSRGFSKLKADGIIKLPNAHSVEIARLDRLRAAAGQDQG
ncbi:MAG: helix-turn-helix domain-containing protein [Alphaproteobacteria bacterium]|nr:helix-turn-helix domain-containing protein [Alphaproteobacteria bacterium]